MLAKDGKMRKTDILNTARILRLIQSVPSPNAEPFKVWLAKVGSEPKSLLKNTSHMVFIKIKRWQNVVEG